MMVFVASVENTFRYPENVVGTNVAVCVVRPLGPVRTEVNVTWSCPPIYPRC